MSLSLSSLLRRLALPCAAAVPIALLSGCAGLLSTAAPSNTVEGPAVISGLVHGGRQPIIGATVTLWAAGNTGYGSAATSLASTTTDANGTFSFHPSGGASYSCPTGGSASQSIYITTSGGQPTTGISNSAAALMVALGDCSTVLAANPSLVINEVTTVASMFALQQFFTPSVSGLGSFGTSATNTAGLANAMATVNNLVNVNTGAAYATTTATATVSGYSTNPVVTITPEQSKINSMADVLAACVNTNGASSSACSTLFGDVDSTAALDTLQAAYYLAVNPTSTVSSTSNIAAIFAVGVANSPFQPSLGSAPTDWTIGVTYGSSSTATAGTYLFDFPTYLAVDGSGNVWVLNDNSTTTTTNNNIVELSPVGVPMTQALTTALTGPNWISIDPSGDAWIANYGGSSALQTSVVEYTTGGTTNTFTTNKGPQRLAIDGKGNVFVLEPSFKGLGDLEEIPFGSANGTTATTLASGLTTDFSNFAIDSNYTIWVTGGGTGSLGGTTGYPYVYQFLYSATPPSYPTIPSATTNAGSITEPEQAISVDSANNVWIQNYSKSTLSAISGTSSISSPGGTPYTVSSSLTKPEFQVTDGAGNVWVTDMATTSATPAGSVYEISHAGVSISPSAGFAHTYNEPDGIAVDPSGNVWVAAYNAAAPNGFVTEIVGQAAPAVTPLAAGLPATPGGTNKLGTRP